MPSIDEFRAELRAQIARAEKAGRSHVEINSGELHRKIGGYPGPDHRMPMCCKAMQEQMKEGDVVLSQPAKGEGANLTIRYMFPRS
jgi:5-methylcytosine-specific restriction protein A